MNRYRRADLLAAFAPGERAGVVLPAGDDFGGDDCDFIGWVHRSGHIAFLVAEQGDGLVGLTLERQALRAAAGGRVQLCPLCLVTQPARAVARFGRRLRVGGQAVVRSAILCADLGCNAHVRGSGLPGGYQLPETLSTPERVARLRSSLAQLLAVWLPTPAPPSR